LLDEKVEPVYRDENGRAAKRVRRTESNGIESHGIEDDKGWFRKIFDFGFGGSK